MVATSQGLAGIALPDPVLAESVRSGLAAVEDRLMTCVHSGDAFVAETARHLVTAGGKRFRPLVVLLAASFGDIEAPEVIAAAAVVELTHLATLYHDDVMDDALVRRGAVSANARWTNTVAILTGDFLFARASDVLADLGPAAVRIQAHTFERLVMGQIHETVGAPTGTDLVEHYLAVVAEKTGSLIATAGRFGAMFGGADPAIVETLTSYGQIIGVAFQLSDDLLDITSPATESGKTPGTDLREGVPTLPVLYALAGDDPAEERLRELIAKPLEDDTLHAEALALLRRSPATERARETLRAYAGQARDLLRPLPDVPGRTALESLADFVVARTS